MKQLKFRVWDKEAKAMLGEFSDGIMIQATTGRAGHYDDDNNFVDDYDVMQFTGLKDKKNIDCYEKDYDEDGNMIDWCDECCGYQFKLIDIPTGDEIFCHNCEGNFMLHDHITDFEIVGNLPELMSGRHEA